MCPTWNCWLEKQRCGQQEPCTLTLAEASSDPHTSRRGVNMLHLKTPSAQHLPTWSCNQQRGRNAVHCSLPKLDAWLITYSAVTIQAPLRLFLPCRYLERFVLIWGNIEGLNLTKSPQRTLEDKRVYFFLQQAKSPIRKQGALLPSTAVCLCKQLSCALSLPGLDYSRLGGAVKALTAIYREAGASALVQGGQRPGGTWKKDHMTSCWLWECKVLRSVLQFSAGGQRVNSRSTT